MHQNRDEIDDEFSLAAHLASIAFVMLFAVIAWPFFALWELCSPP